jgi:hypothetical protein
MARALIVDAFLYINLHLICLRRQQRAGINEAIGEIVNLLVSPTMLVMTDL